MFELKDDSGLQCLHSLFALYRRNVDFNAFLTDEFKVKYGEKPLAALLELSSAQGLLPESQLDLEGTAKSYSGPALLSLKTGAWILVLNIKQVNAGTGVEIWDPGGGTQSKPITVPTKQVLERASEQLIIFRNLQEVDIRRNSALFCFCSIARHHGLIIDIRRIKHEYAILDNEVSEPMFLEIARHYEFKPQKLVLSWEKLVKLRNEFPAIGIKKNGKSLICCASRKNGELDEIVVIDPDGSGGARPKFQFWNREKYEAECSGKLIQLDLQRKAVISMEGNDSSKEKLPYSSRAMRETAELVYIHLGDNCNLSCVYCMGGAQEKKPDCIPIDFKRIARFIESVKGDHPLHLRFFGGEPLLYFDKMLPFIEYFNGADGIEMGAPINGSLLTEEIVTIINRIGNFEFVISHDGKNTRRTRGIDIMDNIRIIDKLNRFSFISVISRENQSIIETWNYLQSKLGRPVFSYPVPIYPGANIDPSLLEINLDNLQAEMQLMSDDFIKPIHTNLLGRKLVSHLLYKIEQSYRYDCRGKTCFCNRMYGNIHLNLSGNRIDCCTSGIKIGTIDSVPDLLRMTEIHLEKIGANGCLTCCVYPICRGGCAVVPGKYQGEHCKIMRAMYTPVVSMAKTLGIIRNEKLNEIP